ncbi:MAG TPA: zinc-binding alcohol dehydrogenase [Thermomicrobiales bacterium]|jgi:alcohol dehydrogenase
MTKNTAPDDGRSLQLIAPRQLAWTPDTLPPLGPRDLLLETQTGAISIGTELPHYLGTSRGATPMHYPQMTGYESVASVRARGSAVTSLSIGARVVATYGHRTYAVVPTTKVIAIPDTVSDAAAVLLILSGDVATGIKKLGIPPPEPVLITGAGTIGLLAVFVVRAFGVRAVDIIEPHPERRELALAFGARRAVRPDEAPALQGGYASGVECSSRDAAFAILQAHLAPHGRICVLADGNREPLTLTPAFHQHQLSVVGSSDCPDYQAHARWYFPLAQRHSATLERLFDQQITADDLPATFAALASGVANPIKVLVHYPAR